MYSPFQSFRRPPAMDCTLADASGIRILSKVITCASKLGDDLTFSATDTGLIIRTINASHSACATFIFRRPFFGSYTITTASPVPARVPARSLVPVLRSPNALFSLRITIEDDDDVVIFRAATKTKVKKTFRVPVHDGGTLPAAIYDKASCSSYITTRARFLLDVLANFHTRLEELVLAPGSAALSVLSHVDAAVASDAHNAMLRTEMTVDVREFDAYALTGGEDGGVSLTFFCKPFRAALDFCEALEATCSLQFSQSGCPLVLSVEIGVPGAAVAFEADFVFATRLVNDASQATPAPAAAAAPFGSEGVGAESGSGSGSVGREKVRGDESRRRPASRKKPKLAVTPGETGGTSAKRSVKRRRSSVAGTPSARKPPVGERRRSEGGENKSGGGRRVSSAGSGTARARETGRREESAGASRRPAADEEMAAAGDDDDGGVDGAGISAAALQLSDDSDGEVAMPTQYDDFWDKASSLPKAAARGRRFGGRAQEEADDSDDDDEDCVPGTPPPE